MGRRGPPPTPTEILRLHGSKLVNQRRDQTEAKGPAGKPTCPSWLDKDAKKVWKQMAPMLDTMGALTRIDANALSRYCETWVRWRKCCEFLKQKGEVYPLKDEQGRIKCLMPFPQVAIANSLAQQLSRLEQEFGLTPSARTRITVSVRPTNKLDKYLGGPGVAQRLR